MPIIPHLLSLPKGLVAPSPQNRLCSLCHRLGAHCHGTYPRFLPGTIIGTGASLVLVPRFLCLHCFRTFSLLPPFLLRRVGKSLLTLIFLGCTKLKWGGLLDHFRMARNTLWSWKRLGKRLLEKIPELLALPGVTWDILSLHLSRWQYPAGLRKPVPTIP